MEPVSQDEFTQKAIEHKDDVCVFHLQGYEVPVIHGILALGASHPGTKSMHSKSLDAIAIFREQLRDVFASWGFSPGQVDFLDIMSWDKEKQTVVPLEAPPVLASLPITDIPPHCDFNCSKGMSEPMVAIFVNPHTGHRWYFHLSCMTDQLSILAEMTDPFSKIMERQFESRDENIGKDDAPA